MSEVTKVKVEAIAQDIVNDALKSKEFLTAIENAVRPAVEKQLAEVIERLEQSEGKVMELEVSMEKRKKEIKGLKKQIESQSDSIQKLQAEMNSLEQYSRRNCLLVFGVKEERSEDTTEVVRGIVSRHLGIELRKDDIDRSHRVQPRRRQENNSADTTEQNTNKRTPPPKPIIVKFTTYRVRNAVISNRRKLKGTGIGIDENLTKNNAELLNAAKKTQGVKAAWSSDGRIIVLVPTSNGGTMTRQVHSKEDLKRL